MTIRHWHLSPPCPACSATCGVTYDHHGDDMAPEQLRCSACGHFWEEADGAAYAQAVAADAAWWAREKCERDIQDAAAAHKALDARIEEIRAHGWDGAR